MALQIKDIVKVKDSDYGTYMVKEFMPKGYAGRKCRLVKVLHSALFGGTDDEKFSFAIIKYFRYVDLKFERKYCESISVPHEPSKTD
jgi:hypothetical protein